MKQEDENLSVKTKQKTTLKRKHARYRQREEERIRSMVSEGCPHTRDPSERDD